MEVNSSNTKLGGFIRFGKRTTGLITFSNETTIADINAHIFERFGQNLPEKYHIEFYSFEKQKFFTLNNEIITSANNPFISSSSINDEDDETIIDCIELYIVNDSPIERRLNTENPITNAINTRLIDGLANALLHPLSLLNETTIDNADIDDDLMEDETSDDYQLSTQSNDDTQSEIGDASDGKCGVSLVQGVKTEEQIKKKKPVSTCFHISTVSPSIQNAYIVIYAVYEKQNADVRIWYQHHDKGFLLHDQLKANAEFVNPILVPLNSFPLKDNGDYILNIYLLTKRNKTSKPEKEIYRLTEQETMEIHMAKHIESGEKIVIKPTRLLCFLRINNRTLFGTIGLSNFIQPAPSRREQPTTTPVQVQLPSSKRMKIGNPTAELNPT